MLLIQTLWFLFSWQQVSLLTPEVTNAPIDLKKKLKSKEEIAYQFSLHEITPLVIRSAPKDHLVVRFLQEYVVDFGNILKGEELKFSPYYLDWEADRKDYYTLTMICPNISSPNTQWLHWLVGNIPGKAWLEGEVLAKYMGPESNKQSGFLRYILLVFKQLQGKVEFHGPRLNDTYGLDIRAAFCVKRFALQNKLGLPVAGNFFITWKTAPEKTS